jgi:type II secretory pathway pseudopilin PulG
MAVVLIMGIILSIMVPHLFRQSENSIGVSRIISDFQYIAQAVSNYASDYRSYPNRLDRLNTVNYRYLPDVSISGNRATIDGLDYTYNPADGDCNSGPSLSLQNLSNENYNEIKIIVGNPIKWRFNDANNSVKLCL